MSPVRAVLLLLAAVTPALAGEGAPAGSPPHEISRPAVQMRLIEEGKSLPIDLATGLALAQAKNLDILAAQARLAEERLAQQVTGDVITARETVLTAAEQIEAALGGLRAAEAAFDLSEVRFTGGVGIGLEVLDAQAALSEARSNVVTAIVTYDVAQVALLRALGGVSVPALLQQADAGGPPSP